MNTRDLIKLAHKADLEGDIELADYLDNQLVRVAKIGKLFNWMGRGYDYSRRPNYDVDFNTLAPDASNLDTMIQHPTQTGGKMKNFFQAGKKSITRTPERLVAIEKQIKDAILNISSSDPKIDAAKKKVQAGQPLTPDERNSLLNILVKENKVATRANNIAVQDVTAVLDGKSPSMPTKEITTVSNAAKALGYGTAAGTVLTGGVAGINAFNQSQYKPGEQYNNQPGIPQMPDAGNSGGQQQRGQNQGGGGYSGPQYNQPKDESRNYAQVYQPANINDQLYGRGPGGYPTYEPIGPEQEGQEYLGGPTEPAVKSYQPLGPTQDMVNSEAYINPNDDFEGMQQRGELSTFEQAPQAPSTEGTSDPKANMIYNPNQQYPPVQNYLNDGSM
jgi:hypothetical protein